MQAAYRACQARAKIRLAASFATARTVSIGFTPMQLGNTLASHTNSVVDNVERFLCEGRSRRAWRCRVLLTLLETLPLTTHGRRFSSLDARERRRLFEQRIIGAQGLWGLCAKVRYLALMGAYGDESVPSSLGVRMPGAKRPLSRVRRAGSLPLVG